MQIGLRARQLAVVGGLWCAWSAGEARAAPCEFVAPTANLPLRGGYAAFMSPAQLAPFMANLPHVDNPAVDAVLRSSLTMWYDEASMVFSYQDSEEFVVGLRANCVGRVIAELSRNQPQVGKLLQLFGEDFRFRFPFRTAAGTDETTGVRTLNFWVPPARADGPPGAVWPVRWWKESPRGRWRWVFPQGTQFGEILYQTGPDQQLYPFEVRVRRRYLDGWQVSAYRPFPAATALVDAVEALRPAWQSDAHLSALIAHLEDPTTLRPYRLTAAAFRPVFPDVDGALDILPDFGDSALVTQLLTTYPFRSTEGLIWREGGALESYAPSSGAAFSIVPKAYTAGMFPTNEDSCNRCHVDTGHPLGNFIPDVAAYGEVWGEDRIFTWHLFEPSDHIFGPWDDDQVSRVINPRLVQAGLLQQGRPPAQDPMYKELPRPYAGAK